MSRTIWNEGRVVGYSAYEVYVRQLLAEDPDGTPATEKEWLSTMLAMGSSMLLRIGTDDTSGLHYVELPFPEDSRLCAANIIMASCFLGDGEVDGSAFTTGWCHKVSNFGPLIHNVVDDCPSSDGSIIPPDQESLTSLPKHIVASIRSYMKIVDGIIIQPGTWSLNDNTPPWEDFKPTLSEVPKIRILLSDKVDSPFYVLLTGFTDRGVIVGTTGFSSAVNTPAPENGDFLGPAMFPWSAKVIFSVPTAFLNYYISADYSRKLPDTAESYQNVTDTSIIDMVTTSPDDYYTTHYSSAPIDISIDNLSVSGDNGAILTVYQIHTDFPPALFGARIPNATTGDYVVCPIDSIAPGNPKIYDDYADDIDTSATLTTIINLEDNAPGTSGYIRDIGQMSNQTNHPATYILYQRDKFTDSVIPVAKVDSTNLFGMLIAREIFYNGVESNNNIVGPHLCIEGSFQAQYFENPVLVNGDSIPEGYDIWTETTWQMKLKDEYAIMSQILPELAQEDIRNTGYISAATIQSDPTPYCAAQTYLRKRITGRLSNTIQDTCGYDVYSINSELTPAFSPGGFWERATMGMWGQIDSGSRSNYYGLVMGAFHSNNHVWPVHRNDHVIDVTVPLEYNIIVNGNPINLIGFQNTSDTSVLLNTKLLGSYWDTSSTGYRNKWAYIDRTAPTMRSTATSNSTGQIFAETALLPVPGLYHEARLCDLYPSDVLEIYGIHEDYWTWSLLRFLRTAVYTDVGTKQPLEPKNSWGIRNLRQPQVVSKKVNLDGSGQSQDEVIEAFRLEVLNSAATIDKTQIIPIPKQLQSTENYPVGTMIQTGRLVGVSLSMIDKDGSPYILEGSAGDIVVPDTGLTWEDIITALYQNKSLDILGDKLSTLRSNIRSVGSNYIEFNDGTRITGQ